MADWRQTDGEDITTCVPCRELASWIQGAPLRLLAVGTPPQNKPPNSIQQRRTADELQPRRRSLVTTIGGGLTVALLVYSVDH